MRSVEVEGDSIDHAIEKALVELGIDRDRASIEILNDASRGLLGFGGRKARVRATVRAPLSETLALAELEERARVERPGAVSRETRPTVREHSEELRRQPIPAPQQTPRSRPSPREESQSVPRETARSESGLAPNIAAPNVPVVRRETPRPPATSAPAADGELTARSQTVLLELLSHLGVHCEVVALPPSDTAGVNLDIRGESTALLIGKRGQTLDAVEYLLNRMLVRDAGSTTRIEIDVEGYRARREESLAALARRMAEKVRQTGRPATVDLMNPRDRRVVHMALKDEAGVASRSQGEGYHRKLIILPAGRRRGGTRPAQDGE